MLFGAVKCSQILKVSVDFRIISVDFSFQTVLKEKIILKSAETLRQVHKMDSECRIQTLISKSINSRQFDSNACCSYDESIMLNSVWEFE